jgi:large subunit ribosomal protein L24
MDKIRKGDEVVVMTGKDKGKRGTVLRASMTSMSWSRASIAPRSTSSRTRSRVWGGIVEKDMPIHVSNVALYNPATQKADRVGFKTLEDGRKVRVFKSNGEVVTRKERSWRVCRNFTKRSGAGTYDQVRLQVEAWKCRASPRSP